MSQSTVQSLFSNAAAAGVLGTKALNAINVEDLGEQIQAGLGVSPDDIKTSEATFVATLIDDSGSIRFGSNAQLVRDGHNLIISALAGTKQKESIFMHCRYLNGTVLYPYVSVAEAIKMDSKNYNPNLGTPLYDETVVLLGTVLAKCQECTNNGIPARTVSAIITDGNDEHSRKNSAKDVAAIVSDMLKQESHIIIGMGIEDGSTDFRAVFRDMGLQDQWILTPGNSPSEIRKAFAMVSQSSVRASQGANAFSKTAMGGFAA